MGRATFPLFAAVFFVILLIALATRKTGAAAKTDPRTLG